MPQIAYVPPSDYLFSGSVSDNIIMSEQQPRYNDMQAASDANIFSFIQSLPNGFDTHIGESGGTVSSGQAQRSAREISFNGQVSCQGQNMYYCYT